MKSLVTLLVLILSTSIFAEEIEYVETIISKSERYIEMTDLIESKDSYEVHFKTDAPEYGYDDEGIKHGGQFDLTLISEVGTGKLCLRATVTDGRSIYRRCETVSGTVQRCTPVIQHNSPSLITGPSIILKKDIIYTREDISSEACV